MTIRLPLAAQPHVAAPLHIYAKGRHMPRKKTAHYIFDQPPEVMHCVMLKERPYWFIRAVAHTGENGTIEPVLNWITACTRCGGLFVDESGFSVFWLHKRCPRHRRKQPPLAQRMAQARRILRKTASSWTGILSP